MENSIEKYKRQALSVIEKAKEVAKIKSQTDYEFAVEYMMDIKGQVKNWEQLHEKSRKAAVAAHDEVMEVINLVKIPGNEAVKRILDPACNQWLRDCRAKRDADEAKLAVIAKKNEIEFIPALAPVLEKTEAASVGTAFIWECSDLMTVVKAVAEGKASLALLCLDEKEISARVKTLGKEFRVPGITVDTKATFRPKRAVNA